MFEYIRQRDRPGNKGFPCPREQTANKPVGLGRKWTCASRERVEHDFQWNVEVFPSKK
jgi:hypothetical protein